MKFVFNLIREKWHPLFYLRKNKVWKELLKQFDPDTSVKISGVKASIKLLRDLSLVFPHDGLEQKSISHFRKVLKQESIEVFFDIGANIGTYSWNALDVGVKDIYLFEPDVTNHRLLLKTIFNNKIKNSYLFPFALGRQTELSLFLVDHVSGAAGTLNEQNNPKSIQFAYDLSQYRKIPVLNLDAFINFAIGKKTLLKIDTEGAERLILEGGRSFINQVRPYIFLECFDKEELKKFDEMNYDIHDLAENYNYYLHPK